MLCWYLTLLTFYTALSQFPFQINYEEWFRGLLPHQCVIIKKKKWGFSKVSFWKERIGPVADLFQDVEKRMCLRENLKVFSSPVWFKQSYHWAGKPKQSLKAEDAEMIKNEIAFKTRIIEHSSTVPHVTSTHGSRNRLKHRLLSSALTVQRVSPWIWFIYHILKVRL